MSADQLLRHTWSEPSWLNRRYDSFTAREWADYLFGSYRWSRRRRWDSAWRWLKHEAWLLTRLPGDTVNNFQRDGVYLVHGGRPGHLRGWFIPGQAIALHVGEWSHSDELWPLIAHNPPETWLPHLERVRDVG